MNTIFDLLDNGTVHAAAMGAAADLPWNPHPAFVGVALKCLVRGADTGGSLSAHLVRLDPGAEIGLHDHAGSWELHQVVGGNGTCELSGRVMDYRPGVSAIMDRGTAHRVRAGDRGLELLAFFAPALV